MNHNQQASQPKRQIENKITEEMEQFYNKRTQEHIDRVVENMKAMVGYKGLDHETLAERGTLHDKSKLTPPEREGYIWLSWWHLCRRQGNEFEYPPGIEDLVKVAIDHHLKNNRHHCESHEKPDDMTILDTVEMVCDFTAISQEYGNPNCLAFVDQNINKMGFSEERKKEIYETIHELNKRQENKKSN